VREISVEKIVEKIEKDVQEKIDSIMEEKNEKTKQVMEEIEKEKERRLNEIEKEKEREIKTLKNRIISQAELESRKKRLNVREEMIERVFDNSRKELRELGPEDYDEYIEESIEKVDKLLEGEVEIHCPKESEDLVKGLSRNINPSLEVIGDLNSIGGIKAISDKGATIDLTFEANLERKKKQLRKDISDILFPEE